MMATFAQSPIAFNAWAALLGSLSKALDVKTRDSLGLAVSDSEWLQLNQDSTIISAAEHTKPYAAPEDAQPQGELRWIMNEDAMPTKKFDERIRIFARDPQELRSELTGSSNNRPQANL